MSFSNLDECITYLSESKGLETTSTHGYSNTIRWLAKKLGEDPDKVPYYLVGRAPEIIELIDREYSNPNSKRTRLSGILGMIRHILRKDHIFTDHENASAKLYDDKAKEERIQADSNRYRRNIRDVAQSADKIKETANDMWTKDICKVVEKERLNTSEMRRIMACVLSQLVTLLPPRRSSDYYNLEIIHNANPTELNKVRKNYLDINDETGQMRLIYFHFKTVKSLGHGQLINVPPALNERISRWVEIADYMQQDCDHKYLFFEPNKLNTPDGEHRYWSRSHVSDTLRTCLNTGVREIRTAVISDFHRNTPKSSRKRNLAAMMGHTVDMQDNIYRRDNVESEIEPPQEEDGEDEPSEVTNVPL